MAQQLQAHTVLIEDPIQFPASKSGSSQLTELQLQPSSVPCGTFTHMHIHILRKKINLKYTDSPSLLWGRGLCTG